MCFSNLPVEFDDDGTPRLAEPDAGNDSEHSHDADLASRATDDDGLDPEARYHEILEGLPDRARERLDDESENDRKPRHTTAE